MTAVLWALLSAFGYGVSDFVGGIASRRVPALRVVLISYPMAAVFLGVLACVVGGHISSGAVLWGALCGIGQAFGVWWFYAAMAAGPMSVVSPLTAILVAGVPLGFGIAMGERPSAVACAGILLALVAVFLVSAQATDEDSTPHRFTAKVAWLTVGSGLAFGLNFVLIHQAPHDARLWPLVFGRLSATAVVLCVALLTRNLVAPRGLPLRLALFASCLDTVANVSMLLALQGSMLSLASVLISLYPAATVALALVVLRERVTTWQTAGMVLALGAVAMIATG
ncbi:EamA family transporter [Mycobacterium sp. MAA66]|uniref:DMT family transporter n=1 Tax=Mycobacterium sp. MAA66 TaxID=3156297 RepID=UPI0035120D47